MKKEKIRKKIIFFFELLILIADCFLSPTNYAPHSFPQMWESHNLSLSWTQTWRQFGQKDEQVFLLKILDPTDTFSCENRKKKKTTNELKKNWEESTVFWEFIWSCEKWFRIRNLAFFFLKKYSAWQLNEWGLLMLWDELKNLIQHQMILHWNSKIKLCYTCNWLTKQNLFLSKTIQTFWLTTTFFSLKKQSSNKKRKQANNQDFFSFLTHQYSPKDAFFLPILWEYALCWKFHG